MKRKTIALIMLGAAARVDAGAAFELLPDQAGPYSPGQSVSVEVWLHNEESFDFDLRLLALDVHGLRARLFAGGDFLTSDDVTVNHVAKLSGGSWMAIDAGLEGPVYALESCSLNGGTTLYAGGKVWGVSDFEATVYRLETGWWSEIGRASSDRVLSLGCWNEGSGNRLYAGGYIWQMEGLPIYDVARWDGNEWSAMQNLAGSVRDMVTFDDGTGATLYVVGSFNSPMPPDHDTALLRVAKWTYTGWAPLGGGFKFGYNEWAANALAVFDDGGGPAVYAAGDFRDVYIPETNSLLHVNNIAKWNGIAWYPVGGGTTPNTAAPIYDMEVFDNGNGPELYIGGDFTTAGGVSVNNIARWDGVAWYDVGGGVTGTAEADVHALTVLDGGYGPALYAGGLFTDAGGVSVSNIAKWDGINWSPVGAGFDDTVRALAIHEATGDPNLVIEGQFQFDFSTLADGGAEYVAFPQLPGPLLVYGGSSPVSGSILHLPPAGSLRLGEMEVVMPITPGKYKLDVASPYGPRGGSLVAFGFGGPDDPYTDWLAESGELTGDPASFVVAAGPPVDIPVVSQWGMIVMTLLLLVVATLEMTQRQQRAVALTSSGAGP